MLWEHTGRQLNQLRKGRVADRILEEVMLELGIERQTHQVKAWEAR